MVSVPIRKTQLNALAELINAYDFKLHDFKRDELDVRGYVPNTGVNPLRCLRVQYKSTPASFLIAGDLVNEKRRFAFTTLGCEITLSGLVPKESPADTLRFSAWTEDFDQISTSFEKWLDQDVTKCERFFEEQEEEENTVDLWAEAASSGDAQQVQMLDNTPFDSEEQARIADSLRAFTEELQNRGLLAEADLDRLRDGIEYVSLASKRLGRKDWTMLTLGSLMSYAVQSGLTSETAAQMFRIATDALNWIWAANPHLLPPIVL